MKIGIVGADKEEWHVKRLLKELKKRKAEVYLLPIIKFHAKIGIKPKISVRGYPIDDYNALIIRRIPGGTAEQVFYRMDILHMLEVMGVRIFNPPESIEKSVNKYYTSALLQEAGIKTPQTIITESFSEAMRGFKELGEDIVVKPLFGSLGKGITRITSEDIAYRVFRALEMTKNVFYIQEYIPHGGEDVRVFIIGDKVVASMKRVSENWKTNLSIGGKAESFDPCDEIKEISLKAAKTLDLDYTGVDVIVSGDNAYLIELNSTPGWEGLQSVTRKDITQELVDYILSKSG